MHSSEKRPYHHGDLRTALIDAAQSLVREHGPEGFTMADASRMAGVSTAAPYRHFADRHALLEEVAARGFDRLAAEIEAERVGWPDGSIDEFVAGGLTYLRFAENEPAVFRLMFGNQPNLRSAPLVDIVGQACFGGLKAAVLKFASANGLVLDDPLEMALPVWSLVHGVASLSIDAAYDCVATDTDTRALLDRLLRDYIAGILQTGRFGPPHHHRPSISLN